MLQVETKSHIAKNMSQNVLTYVYFDPSKISIFPPWEKLRTFILILALINRKYGLWKKSALTTCLLYLKAGNKISYLQYKKVYRI